MAKHGRCTDPKCQYSHEKSRFKKPDGTLSRKPLRAASGATASAAGAELVQEENVDDEGWDTPIGLSWDNGAVSYVPSSLNSVGLSKGAGKGGGAKKPGEIGRLSELPANVWKEVPNCQEGTQFFTRVRCGEENTPAMLDGGSMVNSITEMYVVHTCNRMKGLGIPFKDKRHPVVQFEKWPEGELSLIHI